MRAGTTWAGMGAAMVLLLLAGCPVPGLVGRGVPDDSYATVSESETSIGDEEDTGDDGADDGPILDVPILEECVDRDPILCDADDDDPLRAMGLCDTDEGLRSRSMAGHPSAISVLAQTLGPGTYPVLQGEKMAVMSTGVASHVARPLEDLVNQGACFDTSFCPNTDHDGFDLERLPTPLRVEKVDEEKTCEDDPSLVGEGDCSNTIFDQWSAAGNSGCIDEGCPRPANDYAEIRVNLDVPEKTTAFTFNFAFMSSEYPMYYHSSFNDMFIVWLESEAWTGNISFDEMKNPISLNAAFLDYKDAPNEYDCPVPCRAEELHGFAMEGHAATAWLETTATVEPFENIELVFAIFDLTDGGADSIVLLDGFDWGCSESSPITLPVP